MKHWPFAVLLASGIGLAGTAATRADSPFWPGNWFKNKQEEPVIRPYVVQGPAQRTALVPYADNGFGHLGSSNPAYTQRPLAASPAPVAQEKKKWGFLPVKLPFSKGENVNAGAGAAVPAAAADTARLLSDAEALESAGRIGEAQRTYEQALAHSPSDLNSLLGLARLLDRQGRLEEATAIYERAAAAHPHSPKPVNDLGLCLARRGMLPEAAQTLGRAVQLNPSQALYRNNLATVLVEMGRPDEAYQHLAHAHGPAAGHFNLAVLQHRRGDTAATVAALRNSLAVDPGFGPASEWLAQISQSAPNTSASPGSGMAPEAGVGAQGNSGGYAPDGRVPPIFPPRDVCYPGCPPTPCVSPSYLEETCPIYPSTSSRAVGTPHAGYGPIQQPMGVTSYPTPAPAPADAPAAPAPATDSALNSPWPSIGAEHVPAAEASRYFPRRRF